MAEISLSVFTAKSGALMGCEIVIRPLFEIMQTLVSVISLWFIALIFLVVIAGFILISYQVGKRNIKNGVLIALLVLTLCSIPFVKTIKTLSNRDLKPAVSNYIVNKSYYCIKSCVDLLKSERNDDIQEITKTYDLFDKENIKAFIECNPEWKINDEKYPMERENKGFEVLSPFFKKSNIKPNVVMVVVESLGREWSGENDFGVSFTPFLDSLAQKSLYWKNCLSTAKRSFGAVPALTGSVPHGPKGFQFGNMPEHNSMITILRDNEYKANAFYASDFSFDCVYEYLVEEKVDYMSTGFKKECSDLNKPEVRTYWGYYDMLMFSRSMEELNKMGIENPKFNLFITITSHDALNIKGPEQSYYIDKTKEIINEIKDSNKKNIAEKSLKNEASLYYTDCALRKFFKEYSKQPDFGNTIFVITGDHSAGKDIKNRIGFYHVPLVIWSPLLENYEAFPSIVTHNDVAPSLVGLLSSNFGLITPEYVHWVGNPLDTSQLFSPKSRILFLDYSHEIGEILYDDKFYWNENDAVYEVDEDMNLTQINNDVVKNKIIENMELYKNINNYVYLANHLTKHPIYEKDTFKLIMRYDLDSLVCKSLDDKPSIKPPVVFPILEKKYIAKGGLKKIRMTFSAEILIRGEIWQDCQMNLVFYCNGNEMKPPYIYKDMIIKFLDEEKVKIDTWYKLRVTKEYDVKDVIDISGSIYIKTPEEDKCWTKDNTLYMRDIIVTISGSR